MNRILQLACFLILLLTFSVNGFSQNTITGKVTSSDGSPLPKVSVMIKGTDNGTTTNENGEYTIKVAAIGVLVFSSVGHVTKEATVSKGTSNINMTLQPKELSNQEVVVIAYGQVKKSDLTGSVAVLDSKSFNKGVETSTLQMIQGRSPGVRITQSSSEPGGGFNVRIRGVNSLTAGNDPLYVIDGLPVDNIANTPGGPSRDRSPLNSLNPGDIESISVLKDASATAIYGSRGANGVVIITTKKGKKGPLTVNYNISAGLQKVAKTIKLLSAPQYISFQNSLNKDQGLPPAFTQQDIAEIGNGTNWQDEIFRTAPVQNHQLSFSGGSDNTKYYISLNYLDQQGIVISSGIKRYSTRINLSHTSKKFNFGIDLNTSLVKDDFVPNGNGINAGAGVIATALTMPPILPVRDSAGNYAQTNLVDLENPVALAYGLFDNGETNRTFGNIYGEYSLTDNLKAKINFGSDIRTGRRDTYTSKITKLGQGTNGTAKVSELGRSDYLVELTLNYDKQINKNNHINAVGGYTYQEFNGNGFNASSLNFTTDAFLTDNLSAGDVSTYQIGSGKYKHQLQSYLGRVNYVFKDRYLATASFRIDGSSRFGSGNQYGYFPSVALGWKISDEPFFSNVKSISNLKWRVSYGVTGNQDIGNYSSQVLLGTIGTAIFDQSLYTGIAPIQLGNPNLKWESTKQFNVGFDFGLLNGRISGSMDYYVKNTSNLLLNLPIPTTTGFNSTLQNVGATQNNGFEILIDSRNIVKKFSWTTTVNFATNKNKVTNLAGLPFILQGNARFINDISILRVGDPINAYYGYKVDGIFQNQDEIDKSAQPKAKPGDLKFDDFNGDGKINADDRTILGSPYPKFTFGLNNQFSYLGFALDIFIDGEYGNSLFNFNRLDSEYPISAPRNRQTYVLDRWTPDDPNSRNPSYIPTSVAYGGQANSRGVEDASYLRVQNINLSYSFPHLKSKTVKSLSVFFSAQNLITITNYSGYNPDVSSFEDSNVRVDYNAYPLARIYTLGLNVNL